MDELTRFARRLVEQLTASKEGVNRAVPIGLIREKILPYRTHRRALMLESVEDYETVLLRLVAGERGFVRTQPAGAAKRCQDELAGANPDLGVLDQLADSTIQITSLAAAQIVGDDDGGEVSPSEAPVIASEAKQSRRTAEIASVAPRPREESRPRAATPSADSPVLPSDARQPGREGECRHCHHVVPAGRTVVFCPWCGGRLIPFTCARCQTELDSEWRHCITCGAPVKDPHRYS
jgi:hypothetical protein